MNREDCNSYASAQNRPIAPMPVANAKAPGIIGRPRFLFGLRPFDAHVEKRTVDENKRNHKENRCKNVG